MSVADVATVAPLGESGGFLRVSANCRDTRATIAATLFARPKTVDFPTPDQPAENGGFLRVSDRFPILPSQGLQRLIAGWRRREGIFSPLRGGNTPHRHNPAWGWAEEGR